MTHQLSNKHVLSVRITQVLIVWFSDYLFLVENKDLRHTSSLRVLKAFPILKYWKNHFYDLIYLPSYNIKFPPVEKKPSPDRTFMTNRLIKYNLCKCMKQCKNFKISWGSNLTKATVLTSVPPISKKNVHRQADADATLIVISSCNLHNLYQNFHKINQ